MAMQFYASPEQIMRDRAEYARKNIGRGRSAVVMSYEGGVLFVAENLSTALHKVSEIYDRIGFAAVGRYNEFENLRTAGVRLADLRGYSYDRRDVTGRALANAYAQTLGSIFTEQPKPFEVEICVAEVGASPDSDELYRLTFDGTVQTEPGRLVIGGQSEAVATVVKDKHRPDLSLAEALAVAIEALGSVGGDGGNARDIPATQLEVAVLDRRRPGRTFRRITGAALTALLNGGKTDAAAAAAETPADVPVSPAPAKKDDPLPPAESGVGGAAAKDDSAAVDAVLDEIDADDDSSGDDKPSES
ncbi:proteasome subunit alpha [Virgisporangium aliadipatigenens]|uniref:Proteasome subunit alpha n=1 Tax=Virgisporangium aliadipatigenens TaxID=741659 RepID=A0A8J3YK47_9ACTN|nr:proteasome subunit alpha [Virgisporangium aliadipatigenens]GIJ46651.1 proteasome subunit alpha [Virgisporangium aliadipatigenens]